MPDPNILVISTSSNADAWGLVDHESHCRQLSSDLFEARYGYPPDDSLTAIEIVNLIDDYEAMSILKDTDVTIPPQPKRKLSHKV